MADLEDTNYSSFPIYPCTQQTPLFEQFTAAPTLLGENIRSNDPIVVYGYMTVLPLLSPILETTPVLSNEATTFNDLIQDFPLHVFIPPAPLHEGNLVARQIVGSDSMTEAGRKRRTEIRSLYTCPILSCLKALTSRSNLNGMIFSLCVQVKSFNGTIYLDHLRCHEGKKSYPCGIPNCIKVYSHRQSLQRHTRTAHRLRKP